MFIMLAIFKKKTIKVLRETASKNKNGSAGQSRVKRVGWMFAIST